MKKWPITLVCTVTCLSLLMPTSSTYGDDQVILYDGVSTTQLSFHYGGALSPPRITNSGYVAWSGWTDSDWWESQEEVFLYHDGTVTRLTYSDERDHLPEVNESGQVVWACGDVYTHERIYLYDGSSTIELSDDSYRPHASARPASINDQGHVVWSENVATGCEIFLYDGTNTSQISPDDDYTRNIMPHMSGNGHIVWYGRADADYEIFLYDGTTTSQITDNDLDDSYPLVSNTGDVVWGESQGTHTDILLYDGTETTRIAERGRSWQINDSGQIVWEGGDVFELNIFFYDGESVLQLTDTGMSDLEPHISNSGLVVWRGRIEPVNAIYDIFLYDGTAVTQLTNEFSRDWAPRVNDSGEVVWLSPRAVPHPLWTAATINGEYAPSAAILNVLLLLVLPFASVLVLRSLMRTRKNE